MSKHREVLAMLAASLSVLGIANPTAAVKRPGAHCRESVQSTSLPEWARGGFSGGNPPYVYGQHARIIAVLFSPLSVDPQSKRSNKILWVSRPKLTKPGDLVIHARNLSTNETSQLKVAGGPGPSEIDMPTPGCWRLNLTWSGHSDSIDLQWRAR